MPRRWIACFLISFLVTAAANTLAQDVPFIRGDVNHDASVDLTDAVAGLRVLFLGAAAPACEDTLDADDDGDRDLTDAVYTLLWLTGLGPRLPDPYPSCGADATPDDIACASYPQQPNCAPPFECLFNADLDAVIGGAADREICVPAGVIEFELEGLSLAICPAASAVAACDGLVPGCSFSIRELSGAIDIPAGVVRLHFEGGAEDLPVTAAGTTCSATIVFEGDLVVALDTETVAEGAHRVRGVTDVRTENFDFTFTAGGPLACLLLQGGVALVKAQILDQIAALAQTAFDGIAGSFEGVVLCEDPSAD